VYAKFKSHSSIVSSVKLLVLSRLKRQTIFYTISIKPDVKLVLVLEAEAASSLSCFRLM
jgi:hypothetical protein